MNQAEKISKSLDISIYEAKVYIALNSDGPLLVRAIAKNANIPRTAVYSPLEKLLKKGLASKTIFGKRTYYSAVDPQHLLAYFDEKKILLDQVISDLNQTKKIYSKKSDLETTFYTGEQGIKTAGLIFLNDTKEKIWYSFENIDLVTKNVGFEFESFYVKERVKRKIKSKAIISFSEGSSIIDDIIKNNTEEIRETILLSPHQYPFETTVVATSSLALLINPNENPFALLIRNKYLANTFITIHKCLWDRYKS